MRNCNGSKSGRVPKLLPSGRPKSTAPPPTRRLYNCTKQLAADKFAPQSKLDEDTDSLILAQRRLDQAKLAHDEAVRGFTAEEHQIAEANLEKAAAKVDTIKVLVDQLTVVILWVVKLSLLSYS